MLIRVVGGVLLALCGAISLTHHAAALALSLTPNHGVGPWVNINININKGVLAHAASLSDDQDQGR